MEAPQDVAEALAAHLLADGVRAQSILNNGLDEGIRELSCLANELIHDACKIQPNPQKRKLKSIYEEESSGGVKKKNRSSIKKFSELPNNLHISNIKTSTPNTSVSVSTSPSNGQRKSPAKTSREDPRIKRNTMKKTLLSTDKMEIENIDPVCDNSVNLNTTEDVKSTTVDQHDNSQDDVVIMPPPIIVPVKNKRKKTILSNINNSSVEQSSEVDESSSRKLRTRKKTDIAVSDMPNTRLTRSSSRNMSSVPQIEPDSTTKQKKTRKRKTTTNNADDQADDTVNLTGDHIQNNGDLSQEIKREEIKPVDKTTSDERKNINASINSDSDTNSSTITRPKRVKKTKKKSADDNVQDAISNEEHVDNTTRNITNEDVITRKDENTVMEKSEEIKTSPKIDAEEASTERTSQIPEKQNNVSLSSLDKMESASNAVETPENITDVKESTDVQFTPDEPMQNTHIHDDEMDGVNKNDAANEYGAKESEKKQTVLNETVVIDKGSPIISFPKGTEPPENFILNETVVISGKNLKSSKDDTFNPSVSLLPDEINEVVETPQKPNIPLTSTYIIDNDKVIHVEESPVKKRVKQFEKLAELSKTKFLKDTPDGHDVPKRVTRNKICPNYNETNEIEAEKSKEKSKMTAAIKSKTSGIVKKVIAKCNLPVPIAFKPVGNATKNLHNNVNDILLSPGANAATAAVNREDPVQKRNAYLQAKTEEQRRRREEKCLAAAQARKAQEILKQAQLERAEKEKEEKARQLQEEREEKLREEAEKKRLAQEKKAAELARRMQIAKQKQIEAEKLLKKHKHLTEIEIIPQRVLSPKLNVSNYVAHANEVFDEMIEEDERLENSKISDRDRKNIEEKRKPTWAKKENIDKICSCQKYLSTAIIDELYSAAKFSPNLVEIFPKIDRSKLKRTSSAVWKTPPRCSMMPANF